MAKICMVAFSYYATDSRTRRQTEALIQRGDEVDVVCLKEAEKWMRRNDEGVNFFTISIKKYRGDSNVVYLIKYFSFFVLTFFLLSFLYLKKRYEIIQVHTLPDFLVFAALLPKLLGAKIILDVHELMPELYASKFGMNERHRLIKLITWVERRSIAFADKAIAVHLPHRDILVSHGNPLEKFCISLNLPDPRLFARPQNSSRQNNDGKFRLIYHGTIAKRHGLEVAFRALRMAKEALPAFEFYVMGDGDDLERLIGTVKDLELADCVKFEGRVPLQEIPSRLGQAHLGIVPILYDAFTRYMLPVKLMEYIRLGIPVIASRTETMEAYFDETMVRYFQPGNERELARHIVDLYQNPQKRKLLALNADKFNERFSWENQKKEYYDLIDSLL
jgi:glycosyltransferase involved in cell wall biosynthesis